MDRQFNIFFYLIIINIFLLILEFEWMLGQTGAVKTKLKDNPRPKTRDVLFDNLLTNM